MLLIYAWSNRWFEAGVAKLGQRRWDEVPVLNGSQVRILPSALSSTLSVLSHSVNPWYVYNFLWISPEYDTLNINFKELCSHVYSRININPCKEEIIRILDIEMKDSLCKCFTGRISRLINCLSGFDDLVTINISEAEQIGQIISLIREQLVTYDVNKHKELVRKELINRNYDENVILEWINYIE